MVGVQQTLKDIFAGYVVKGGGVFKNRIILSHEHIPDKTLHRDDQIKQLANIIAPLSQSGKISNIFIYGKTGTGKTVVARHVTSEFEKSSPNVKVLYINCKMKRVSDTEYRLLAELSRMLGKEVPPTGLPTDQVYRIFYETIESMGPNIILVLDEIDALIEKIGDGILYNLTRINQDLKKARISIIGISNSITFTDSLDPRVKSSLSEEEIIFPPYNAEQLKDILTQRANLAFNTDSLERGVVEKCSALAAQEHGDARKALDLLRIAGEISERGGRHIVMIKDVDNAENKLDLDRVVEIVRTQPKQSLAVLAAIIKLVDTGQKEIQTGEIFSVYEGSCSNSGLKSLTQRRVSDLIAELDTLGVINARVISRGRYGRTKEIRVQLSKPVLRKVKKILEDNYLF